MHTGKVSLGQYVRFSERPDRLRVYLLPEGRQEIREWRAENARRIAKGQTQHTRSDLDMFMDLIEDFRMNGWTEVRPEQVGDLRDDSWLVISNDYSYTDENSDDGMIVGTAYSYNQYAVESYIDPLVQKGYIDLSRHDYLESWEVDYVIAQCRPDLFLDNEAERQHLLTTGERRIQARQAQIAGQMQLPLEEGIDATSESLPEEQPED